MNKTQSLIEHYAHAAGLSPNLQSFDKENPLAFALAKAPYLMAPMAGVSDAAYRLMARMGGAALAYSEMVSVAGIHYKSDKTWELVDPDPSEPDIAVQLFGSKPEQFFEATQLITKRLRDRLALIDINMACPVPKVTKKGEGSALLDDVAQAQKIVDACVRATSVPVTVKIRKSRRALEMVAPEFAAAMVEAGASAIAVHGRSANQMYSGTSDDEVIASVVRAVSVPVIASGDILTPERASQVRTTTGATGAFCARGTYGNPWIFKDAAALDARNVLSERDIRMRMEAFLLHVRLLEATGAHMARARSLAGWYFKGIPDATSIRAQAIHLSKAAEFEDLTYRVLERSQVQEQHE